jgi:hypothetical protein
MRKLLLSLALLVMGGVAFVAATPASAAPAMPQSAIVDTANGAVLPIHWHHHHHGWGWGYGGPGYWGYGYHPRRCFWRWSNRRQAMIRVCYRRW